MRKRAPMDTPEIPIAPMIDCVFLMLVYFMTTSSLDKSEADLVCPVGQAGLAAVDPLPAVDEQRLALTSAGIVLWNGSEFPLESDPGSRTALVKRLEGFAETCRLAGSDPSLRIEPEEETRHQSLVILLDRVSHSGITTLHFP